MSSCILLKDLVKAKYPELSKKDILSKILCGEVFVDNECILDPKFKTKDESNIIIKDKRKYVSRGGDKLAHALWRWNLSVKNKVFIDAGVSTGGFTDCLIQKGAKLVYAVDVGYNQIDYKLRINPKVKLFERMKIQHIHKCNLKPAPDAAVMDLSFRSIRGISSYLLNIVEEKWLLSLIKPQFEWKNPVSGFNGIIADEKIRCEILITLLEDLWLEKSYVNRICQSPISGRKGNIEFFFLISKEETKSLSELKDEIPKKVLKGVPG
jgi:23S rRNA (cytidine1920-2'-O)/16S rRNA (cytidine1409-2'-O)-methyltransferase